MVAGSPILSMLSCAGSLILAVRGAMMCFADNALSSSGEAADAYLYVLLCGVVILIDTT